jgi:hypothetical protein
MFDEPTESPLTEESSPAALRFRANACRALAETTDSPESKSVWLKRADYWDALAVKAEQAQGPQALGRANPPPSVE